MCPTDETGKTGSEIISQQLDALLGSNTHNTGSLEMLIPKTQSTASKTMQQNIYNVLLFEWQVSGKFTLAPTP